MLNQIAGIATVMFVVICTIFAFRSGKNNKVGKALALIFACGLVIRIFSGMDFYLNPWDERYHALAAKSLLDHPLTPTLYDNPALDYDYRDWVNNHIWIHKPPMTLWMMAASMKIFGINEIAIRVPSILFSSLGIFLTFFIAKHFFDDKIALLASFFYAINGLLIDLAAGHQPTDHPDTLFIFFVELGIFFSVYYLHRPSSAGLFLVGVATGFSVLTKWLPGLLVIAVLLLLLLHKESWKRATLHCLVVFAIAFIVFIPWQIYIYTAFPQEAAWESYFNYRHLFEPLDGHDGTVFYQLAMMPRVFGELIYIPLLLFFYTLYKKQLSADKLVLVLWFALPYLFFSFVATKMPGYVMISAPPIFIMLSWAFWAINEKKKKPKYRIATMFLLALLLVLPIRYSIERVKPFESKERHPAWTKELQKLENKVGASKAAVFNIEHYIEAMFYAKVSAYPFIPDQKQIDKAVGRGFKVFIYDDSRIPPEIRHHQNVAVLSHD